MRDKERSCTLKLSRKFNMRLNLMLEFLQNMEETFLSYKVLMMKFFNPKGTYMILSFGLNSFIYPSRFLCSKGGLIYWWKQYTSFIIFNLSSFKNELVKRNECSPWNIWLPLKINLQVWHGRIWNWIHDRGYPMFIVRYRSSFCNSGEDAVPIG
jgi:hypothetical protein